MSRKLKRSCNWMTALTLAGAAGASCVACGGGSPEPRVQNPSSYDDQFSAELEQERQEFIRDTQERLNELDQRIAQMKARIEGESQYVSESQRAEWQQELFELQRQREDAQARLQRARTASPSEWKAARNNVALTVDRLEAGVSTLGSRISRLFSSEPEQPAPGAEPGMEDERQPVGGEDEPMEGEEPNEPMDEQGPNDESM